MALSNSQAPQPENPPIDARGFRDCLGQFGTGVTVVTARHAGQKVGVTANSFASLSLDPPLVLWSINRTSRAFGAFTNTQHFAVSILSDEQIDISQRFASKETDKFANVAWHPGRNGVPLISDSAARIECTTETRHEAGDHVLIIGRVTHFEREDRGVLLFSQGRYKIGIDHPVLGTRVSPTTVSAPGTPPAEKPFGSLLYEAHLLSTRGFDAERASLGLTVAQGRILYVLSQFPNLSLDRLIRNSNLPEQTLRDAVDELRTTGDVMEDPDGCLRLTESGRLRRAIVLKRTENYEANTLKGISKSDLSNTRTVLENYITVNSGKE
jgi:flavin reductase (DIM6/NTAB) family NADH-FMN oxidoreductase RutF/DNA-binding MarR family transcriptional regulator